MGIYAVNVKWIRAAVLAVSLLAIISPAWSDGSNPVNSADTKKLCYCGCDHMRGSAMCMHMCELAKYQSRWWAASCQKKQDKILPPASSGQRTNSKTNNHTQQARL